MAKILVMIGGQSLRLPGTVKLDALQAELDQAAQEQRSVVIRCEMNDDPRQHMDVRVNPHNLGWWAVVDL